MRVTGHTQDLAKDQKAATVKKNSAKPGEWYRAGKHRREQGTLHLGSLKLNAPFLAQEKKYYTQGSWPMYPFSASCPPTHPPTRRSIHPSLHAHIPSSIHPSIHPSILYPKYSDQKTEDQEVEFCVNTQQVRTRTGPWSFQAVVVGRLAVGRSLS